MLKRASQISSISRRLWERGVGQFNTRVEEAARAASLQGWEFDQRLEDGLRLASPRVRDAPRVPSPLTDSVTRESEMRAAAAAAAEAAEAAAQEEVELRPFGWRRQQRPTRRPMHLRRDRARGAWRRPWRWLRRG